MLSNCWVISFVWRVFHKGSKIKVTLDGKGPNGSAPHAYVLMPDGKEVHFRSKIKPLPWWGQILFDGELKIIKGKKRD